MSYRRSISFSENETDLLKYFDENGKSEIAKIAMKFYQEHKNNVITEPVLKLISLLAKNNHESVTQKSNINNHAIADKFAKLKK